MALVAIMEPAIENQSSRVSKQPLKSCPSNKGKVLLDSGSNGDLYFLPKGKDKPFLYLTRQVLKSLGIHQMGAFKHMDSDIRDKFCFCEYNWSHSPNGHKNYSILSYKMMPTRYLF